MIFSHRWHCDTVFRKERDIIKFHGNVPCSLWHTLIHAHTLTRTHTHSKRGLIIDQQGRAQSSVGGGSFFLAGPRWQSKGVQRGARDPGLWKLITLRGNYESRAQVWPWRGDLAACRGFFGGEREGTGSWADDAAAVVVVTMCSRVSRVLLLVFVYSMRRCHTLSHVWAD